MSLRRMRQIGRNSCSSLGLLCGLALLTICTAPATGGDPQPAEKDVICHPEGCYAVFLQRKVFREAGRSCREGGGTLATMHNAAAAGVVHELLSAVEQQGLTEKFRLWIGLHRAPRQCSTTRPLRGFVWVTGDQDGQYTNWLRDDSLGTCAAPRCVAVTMALSESASAGVGRFRWVDGSCALPLDGYVCQYASKATCPPLGDKGGGPPLYTTPFHLQSTRLTYVPAGSVATVPCPGDTSESEALTCTLRGGGGGWLSDGPSCPEGAERRGWCGGGEHRCEQHCHDTTDGYYCYCSAGFSLDEDRYSCKPDPTADPVVTTDDPPVSEACLAAGCRHGCTETARGVRCTCPPGYQAGPDGRGCVDVDECRQGPCPQLCVNTPGTFHCACKDGYRPDDDGEGDCVDVDECLEESRGGCRGECRNTEGSFACLCEPGYRRAAGGGEGECVDVDECNGASPCQHGCQNVVGGYRCYCDNGYELQDNGFACHPSLEDEEYSTLTPDPGDAAHDPNFDQDLPWSTSLPLDPNFENDPEFDSEWLTMAPGPLPGSDDHLNQWDDPSPREYPTVPLPPQYDSRGNQIDNEAEAKTGLIEAGDRAETDIANGSGSATVGKPGAGTGIGEGEAREDRETGEGHGGTGEVGAGSATGKKKHDKSWLLVALLVPLCVFLVVMLALGIVYCTSCAVDKSQRFSDCYRWIIPAAPPGVRDSKPQA